MARGRKRIWFGVSIVVLAVAVAGVVVRSGWYGLSLWVMTPWGGSHIWVRGWTLGTIYGWQPAPLWPVHLRGEAEWKRIEQPRPSICIFMSADDKRNPDVWRQLPPPTNLGWFGEIYSLQLSSGSFHIVAWPIPLLIGAFGMISIWHGRRALRRNRAHLCVKCGYDTRGLPSGTPCPECGAADRATHAA